MPLDVAILYRGDLSSCNYDCAYCPFAKHWESPAELQADRRGLTRFVDWAHGRAGDRLAVFFTPWGEALVRRWYRDAVVALSQLPQVWKVAVQTNLSCALDWLAAADASRVGLWCTYHPSETTIPAFLRQCQRLDEIGVRYSVGCVGLREHLADIECLRRELPPHVYLWVNAFKSQPDYYDQPLLEALAGIDPLFPVNNVRHVSRGHACRTGQSVFSVDGAGDMRRCHFVKRVIGNIYEPEFERVLAAQPCPNDTCGCHIGYVHLERLGLDRVFGAGILERAPDGDAAAVAPWQSSSEVAAAES